MLPDYAWNWIVQVEGGHSNDTLGGDTWFGIARNYHPGIPWPPTADQARAIYDKEYWGAAQCDQYKSDGLALAVFDSCVNPGIGAAMPMFQASLRVRPDGVVGPKTLNAIQILPGLSKRAVLANFLARRVDFYRKSPVAADYFFGWVQRCFVLQQVCLARL